MRIGNVIKPVSATSKAQQLEMTPRDVIEVAVYGAEGWADIVAVCTMKSA
jgi:hypothetical protein